MSSPPAAGLVTGIDHYENFPVASVLVPARLRPAVLAIYRFARFADDVADEGDAAPETRLRELERLRTALTDEAPGLHPVVDALRPHLARHGIPVEPFLALLSAFSQDVTVVRYADDAALEDYCRRSANPVGQLVLALFGRLDRETGPLSDAICTALQLINFLQDIASDWGRGRIYLPASALSASGIGEREIDAAVRAGRAGTALRDCIAARATQARALLESGAPLVGRVPLRLSLELRGTLAGGRRILDRLERSGFDPIANRPKLGWRDAPALVRLMAGPARREPPRQPAPR
ncbi:MAG: Dehydrosqualene synthase [Pseudomonadota bacterium]|jgi:squalene synthase HpnC